MEEHRKFLGPLRLRKEALVTSQVQAQIVNNDKPFSVTYTPDPDMLKGRTPSFGFLLS